MIKHVVLWRIKSDLSEPKNKIALEIKSRLEALPPQIPEIQEFVVGVNEKESEMASDVVLISAFENYDALTRYANHPEHLAVGDYLKSVVAERQVVDYTY